MRPYAALGPIIGWRAFSSTPGEWGYGAIGNIGSAVDISELFTLSVEVAGIAQVDRYDGSTTMSAAPSFALSWRF